MDDVRLPGAQNKHIRTQKKGKREKESERLNKKRVEATSIETVIHTWSLFVRIDANQNSPNKRYEHSHNIPIYAL